MMSDTHYISRSMVLDNDSETMLNIAVTEQALADAAEKSDTIIISGDLTDKGDRPSHEDFIKLLRSYTEKGKKIYVIFATHDFHHHRAYVQKWGKTNVEYTSMPWDSQPYFDAEAANFKDYVKPEYAGLSEEECTPQLAEACAPEELWEMYYEFGPAQAMSRDDGSFSYCIDLDENTRCLMLNDIFRNEEALQDKTATFTPHCFKWIKSMIDKAKEDGKFIFVCSHHPFMPTVPVHRLGTSNRNLRSPEPGHMLADMGINLLFAGHTHATAVDWLTSDKGNCACHILTPSVRFYPPAFREVELDGLNGKISYELTDVSTPGGVSIPESTLREHYYKVFYKDYFRQYTSGKPPFNKIVAEGKLGDFGFLFKKKARLTEKEYAEIKDKKLFDFLSGIVFNMLTGDGSYTPETPEYRILMSIAAIGDSIIDAQPFADIRNKVFKGYTVSQVAEGMLFKNGVSDCKAAFDFTKKQPKHYVTSAMKSHVGDILMLFVWILSLPVSLLAPAAAAIGIPVKYIMKKINIKKHPASPLMRY